MSYTIVLPVVSALISCAGATDHHSQIDTQTLEAVEQQKIRATYFSQKFPLKDVFEKSVDNRGNGNEGLYGVRNFRAVLKGVYYRGGANNAYHRNNRRDNSNPLPNDGLNNLCEENFNDAIYLYRTNYNTAPKTTNCQSAQGPSQLSYHQWSSLDEQEMKIILKFVFDRIMSPEKGPVYVHCWNGWHASGYSAAIVLRQFCGWGGAAAVEYWDRNTDGNNKSTSYERIRTNIRNYKFNPELSIPADVAQVICPDNQGRF